MKSLIATIVTATILSVGTLSTASATPVASAPITAGSDVQTVEWRGRGHREGIRRHHRDVLPTRAIVRRLHRQGYRDIRSIRRHRGDYTVIARGYRGRVRLVVDGRTGRVLDRDLLRRDRRHYREPGFRFGGRSGNFSYQFNIR